MKSSIPCCKTRRLRCALWVTLPAAWLALVPLSVGAQSGAVAPPVPAAAPLEEVLVTGEQPGPGMWRVSRNGHDLWIIGTLEPLPKKMNWRSKETEAIIAESQEVLAPPDIDFKIGFFKELTAVPTALRARKNADGATLEQILPPALYARWRALKAQYLPRNSSVEKFHPFVAARELYVAALDRVGLSSEKIVWKTVKELAHAHHVPVRTVTLPIKVDDPKGTLRELELMPRALDIACLERTMQRIETDLAGMRQRANLWALGDVQALRALPYPDELATCYDAVASVPALGPQVNAARDNLAQIWVAATESALSRNQSTFAVLSIYQLLQPKGVLEQLKTRGYRVEGPGG